MNMTVLFKKCTYWLLLIATTIISFCNAEIICTDTEIEWTIECPPFQTEQLTWENWSALYINEIQHEWKWIINIEIPTEIARDYTTDDNTFNLTVEWYWYDEEKITNIINTQNYKPTPEEMSELVWKIADFLPLVAITWLILRARRLIKKLIFKS